MPGETMVLHSHPHWWHFFRQLLEGVGVVVLFVLWLSTSGALSTLFGWLTIIALIGWVIDSLVAFATWQTTRFAITDQRVAYQTGLLRRKGVSIPLERVNNVNFEQGVIERMLDNGTLTIESAGETGDSVFRNIPDPDRARSLIFQQMEAYGDAKAARDASAVARAMQADRGAQGSVEDRLAKLDELRVAGAISEDEYAKKRADILDDL